MNQKHIENDSIPEFWVLFPPGLLTFLTVIILTLLSGGASLAHLIHLSDIDLNQAFAKKYVISLFCVSIALCIPNLLIVRGFNRFAIKIIRWQLLAFIVISIPFVLVELRSNAVWTGAAALVSSTLALTLTYTTGYQRTPQYFERLINWKKEQDHLKEKVLSKKYF